MRCGDYGCGCDDRNCDAGPDAVSAMEGLDRVDDDSSGIRYRNNASREPVRMPRTLTCAAWRDYRAGRAGLGSVALAAAGDAAIFSILAGYVLLSSRLRR